MVIRRLPAALLAALVLASMAPAASASGPGSVRLEGTLELEISENIDARGRLTRATYDYYVRDERGQRTRVSVAGEPPAGMEPKAKVRITGQRTGAAVAAEDVAVLADAGSSGTADVDGTGQLVDATAPVTKRLAVILVNFASNPVQPYTATYATGIFFANTNSIAAFYAEESYG